MSKKSILEKINIDINDYKKLSEINLLELFLKESIMAMIFPSPEYMYKSIGITDYDSKAMRSSNVSFLLMTSISLPVTSNSIGLSLEL